MTIDGIVLPGTEPTAINNRGFVYVELLRGEDPNDVTDAAADAVLKRERRPAAGGTFHYFFIIGTPEGEQFACFTYNGDILGWCDVWRDFASSTGRGVGEVLNDALVFSDGRRAWRR